MLPKNLKYQNKVESAAASAYTSNIAPQNGTGPYSAGQTIIINIPTRANLCLIGSESTLKFSLTATNSAGAATTHVRLDRAGANGCIQRLRLYSGSNLLEDIDNYGLLMANLISLQKSNAGVRGKFNITNGTRADDIVIGKTTLIGAAYAANNADSTVVGSSFICPGGELLTAAALGADATSPIRTYSISLLSILGTLGAQYLPLFAMTSSPLRLEIQLVDSPNKFICSNKALSSFSLTNVEYVASFLELSDSSMEIINNSLGGQPLQYVVPSFRNYVFTQFLPSGGAQFNIPVAAKFSSLKSLFGIFRDSTKIGAATFFPYASGHFKMSSYNLRLGSKIIPAKAPSSITEYFIEACKAIGSVSDINHCPTMNMYSYDTTTNVANTETTVLNAASAISSNFLIGVDLEVYANADKDSIFSGYNSTTDDIFCQAIFSGTGADVASLRSDFYAMYDSLLICENSTAYVKF
jgi:hypothetical protein